jgi:hypothetical protein
MAFLASLSPQTENDRPTGCYSRRSADPSPEGADRRQNTRLPCRLSALCREEGESETIRARVVDASVGGLCLLVGRDYSSGVQLVVELRDPTGASIGTVRCLVAHSSKAANGLWRLGCTVSEGSILPS